jgi:hypothetical protein
MVTNSSVLQQWIMQQESIGVIMPPWRKCEVLDHALPQSWSKGTASKVLGISLAKEALPEQYTVLGGMCSIFTAESEAIRLAQIRFSGVVEFSNWLRSWYPRLDQVHDTVGIPPRNAQRIVYVCEDSIFARRLAAQTGFKEDELLQIFRTVHEQQGHPVLLNWVRQNGYHGPVEVVYTSDLAQEIDVALRIWQRLGRFKISARDKDMAAVKLMYTPLWLDILGVKKGVVYEPAAHMFLEDRLDYLRHWFKSQCADDIGLIGYLPFWSSQGQTRMVDYTQVPNWGNWQQFQIHEGEESWYAVNTLFTKKNIIHSGPELVAAEEVKRQLALDLTTYYGGV